MSETPHRSQHLGKQCIELHPGHGGSSSVLPPLMLMGEWKKWTLCGVGALGRDCCRSRSPGESRGSEVPPSISPTVALGEHLAEKGWSYASDGGLACALARTSGLLFSSPTSMPSHPGQPGIQNTKFLTPRTSGDDCRPTREERRVENQLLLRLQLPRRVNWVTMTAKIMRTQCHL